MKKERRWTNNNKIARTGSSKKTLFAWVRLIPTAPDRTDSRNTVVGGSFAKA